MTILVKQSTNAAGFGATTQACSFGTLPTSGNAVIVAVNLREAFSTITVGVTDNQGNTYSQVASGGPFGGTASETYLFWCSSIGASSGTFTVTATFNSSPDVQIVGLMEVSGLSGSVDQTGSGDGTGVSTCTVTCSSANSNAADLVVASASLSSFDNVPTGMSDPATGEAYTSWYFQDGEGTYGSGAEGSYRITSSTETSTATWSWTVGTDTWSGAIASFKGSGAAIPSLLGQICL